MSFSLVTLINRMDIHVDWENLQGGSQTSGLLCNFTFQANLIQLVKSPTHYPRKYSRSCPDKQSQSYQQCYRYLRRTVPWYALRLQTHFV